MLNIDELDVQIALLRRKMVEHDADMDDLKAVMDDHMSFLLKNFFIFINSLHNREKMTCPRVTGTA